MPMTLPSFPRPLSLVIIRQMALFEEGDRENFFRVYDTFVPEQFRVMDLDAQKVEFWLQIYFAVFPALPSAFGKRFALVGPDGGADLAPGIAKLREYIETRGAEAARTEEFLPYYALPHVARPQIHPAFKALFEPKWTIDLRGMLERFLSNAPDEIPPPRIHTILKHYYGIEGDDPIPRMRAGPLPGRRAEEASQKRPPTARRRGRSPAGDGTSAEAPSAFGAFQASAYAPIQSAGFDGALGSAATARGITPLLEGKITLDEFCPAPDYSDLGAEVLSLDSLAAQVKSLEPRTPPDSPPRDGYGRLAKETPASEKKKPTPAKKTPAKPLADEAGTGHPRAAAAGGAFADVSSEFRLVENSRTEVELSGASASRESDSESDSLKRPLEAKYLTAPEVPGWIAAPYPETLDLVPVDFGAVVLEFRSGVERLLDATEQLGPEAEEAESRVARLLQALRWRITRAPEGSVLRVEATRTTCKGDVFALQQADLADSSESGSGSLVDALLLGCRGRVRAECLRLVNALATSGDGRRYLLSPGSRVASALALCAEPREADTIARRNLLGAMQKLSFHALAAERMSALGVLPWVTKVLLGATTTGEVPDKMRASREGVPRISDYDAEHGAALLMNLVLTNAGKRSAEAMMTEAGADPEQDVLEVLKMLLQSPDERTRTHANGALYSLLQRESIRVAATDAGFGTLLEELREHSDPVFYRQLTHVLGALRGHGVVEDPAAAKRAERDAAPNARFRGYRRGDPEPFVDFEPLESDAEGHAAAEDANGETPREESGDVGEGVDSGWIPVGANRVERDAPRLFGEALLAEEYFFEELVDDEGPPLGGYPEEPLSPYRAAGAAADALASEVRLQTRGEFGLDEEDVGGDLEIDAAGFETRARMDEPLSDGFGSFADREPQGDEEEEATGLPSEEDGLALTSSDLDPDTGGFGAETVGPDELDAASPTEVPGLDPKEDDECEIEDTGETNVMGGEALDKDDAEDDEYDAVDDDADTEDDETEAQEALDDGEDLSREIPVGAAAEPEPLDPLLRPDALAAGEDSGENARL